MRFCAAIRHGLNIHDILCEGDTVLSVLFMVDSLLVDDDIPAGGDVVLLDSRTGEVKEIIC